MTQRSIAFVILLASMLAPPRARAQERGAGELAELVRGLGVTARVLVIGAHPDDEDTQLIAWLARGRQVETAYLSLTRGDGGQNLIGNELGEALGAIRTEELLAARRIDGGRQYFTRAYDFGFSKSAEETFRHWPKDSILRDVVTVVRDFRPHVIVAVFSGTPRDGHGHHQVSGLLAREAYDIAGDGIRMPAVATQGRRPWAPMKFYRSARFRGADSATYRFDVGEFSPLRGRSYAELAAESRSQHKSQAFGTLQPKGPIIDAVRLEASRVAPLPRAGTLERSLFDGVDTSWMRLSSASTGAARAMLDSIPSALETVRHAYDPFVPESMLPSLARLRALVERAAQRGTCATGASADANRCDDLERSLQIVAARTERAIGLASGIAVEATVDHETWAVSEPVTASVAVYNRGSRPVSVDVSFHAPGSSSPKQVRVSPHSVATLRDTISYGQITSPAWLATPRHGDMFSAPLDATPQDQRSGIEARVGAVFDGARIEIGSPLVYRYADPIKGEIQRPIAIVPAVAVSVDQPIQYVPANRAFERTIRVALTSASNHPRAVRVSLQLPRGLTADSTSRTIGLPDYAGHFGAESDADGLPGGRSVAGSSPLRTVDFRVRGNLPEGRHTITVLAESEGHRFTSGYTLVEYDHIRPQRLFRDATISLSAVDVRVSPNLVVAYVPGVGDNVAPMLEQLGVPLTVFEPEKLAGADLSRFTTVVVGPRAYESSPALVAANQRLLDFARRGGTLVVQYGQYEMANPGMMPYPVTLARPADRVTEEDAPVRVLDPSSPLLAAPNRMEAADWKGWVQERTIYMPRTHDERYRAVLSVNDPGEPPNDGALLVAAVGRGTYVYTTLALFRQLPAAVPGAARLFVNLLSADQRAAAPAAALPKP